MFNVVTGSGSMGQMLAEHPDVDKVAFTGSTQIGKVLRQATAGTGKKLSLELGGKSIHIHDKLLRESTLLNLRHCYAQARARSSCSTRQT